MEHLFQQIELKVIAAKIGFIKVEFEGNVLVLHFPPPEEKAFYEDNDAPFQKIMGRIHELKQFHPHLKQDNKQLKLAARIKLGENQKERLNSVRAFLEKLVV